MKSPVVMTSPYHSPLTTAQPAAAAAHDSGLITGRRNIQRGLLARAATYANAATKGSSMVSQFNGITLPERDPIVWGDASNRYRGRQGEINNNAIEVTAGTEKLQSEEIRSAIEINATASEVEWRNEVHITSSPFLPNFSEAAHAMEGSLEADITAETRVQSESKAQDSGIAQRLSFHTTQQLRSGFFRSIKRQYSPILPSKDDENQGPGFGGSLHSESGSSSVMSNTDAANDSEAENEEEAKDNFSGGGNMSQLARKKLDYLRNQGPNNVDVSTGLQWIRLELHEMREQDKTLFLQLIKLHSTIKELRSDISGSQEFDDYDDLHSAASLWWPRRQYSASVLPDFSSSDGAQIFRNGRKPPLRRGFSLNYPPSGSSMRTSSNMMSSGLFRNQSIESEQSLISTDSSSITIRSATAC